MTTTKSRIRMFNFRLLDKILHNGNFEIVANSYTNPLDENFDKPLKIVIKKNKRVPKRLLNI